MIGDNSRAEYTGLNVANRTNNSKAKLFFRLILIYALFALVYVLYNYVNNNHTPISLYKNRNDEFIQQENGLVFVSSNETKCSPLIANASQYYVVMDGLRYPQFVPLHQNVSINFECLNSRRIKKILVWNSFFGDENFSFGMGVRKPFVDRHCPVHSCEMTNDHAQITNSDLVLTHMRDPIKKFDSKRSGPNQRFVFVLYESPMHSRRFDDLDGKYNLTATYRFDSDFPGIYQEVASMIWSRNVTFDDKFDFRRDKKKMAFIIVSNCYASNGRMKYLQELQKHIQVDIYGKCGKPCPVGDDCKATLSNEYLFYLAFENSNCRDYITEKFHNTLKHELIPIVYGGANYSYFVRV